MRHWIAGLSIVLCAAPAWAGDAPVLAREEASAAPLRFIPMEGGRNFRDVGGYRTQDGRAVKWGVLYRSGSLGALTVQDQVRLTRLQVHSIIDLRTTQERGHDMSNWLPMAGLGYWSRDYGMSLGNMGALFADRSQLTADRMRGVMQDVYRKLPQEQAPSYRELFSRLLGDKGAVVVNCTAGKDRTGVATALVLTALGVPYDMVRQDFLLSNGAPGMETLGSSIGAVPALALPAEVLQPLTGVEGEYLDMAFGQIRQDYGSVEAYLERELGLGAPQIAQLRQRMLD